MNINVYENQYRLMLLQIMAAGTKQTGRNGAVQSLFGQTLSVDLGQGFPLLTGRKMHVTGIFGEMCAFMRGLEALSDYVELGCNYWVANAQSWYANRDKTPEDMLIGQYVGSLWRDFSSADEAQSDAHGVRDQLFELYHSLRDNPSSRRHVLSAWHPGAESCLPPCTVMAIFDVRNGKLNCHVTQRSADMCLGVPSDVAGYALLVHVLCAALGYTPGQLMFTFVNAHVYEAHKDSLYKYIAQEPKKRLPSLHIESPHEGFQMLNRAEPKHFVLSDYECGPVIKFPFVV